MYDLTRAIECLKGTVGFKQNENPRYPKLENNLITTDTGVDVDNPLITVENIWQTRENTDGTYYEEWTPTGTWEEGNRIKVTNTGLAGPTSFIVYESTINGNTGNDPSAIVPEWNEVDLISEYLNQVKEDAINDTLRDLYNKKKLHQEVKNLIQDVKVYRRAGRIYRKEVKDNRFVGFEIQVKNYDYLTAVIERIGVQFSEENINLPIYIYHTSKIQPILTYLINNSQPSDFEWNEISNAILKYNSRTHDIGGSFFIGYKESELQGQAIINTRDMSKAPCSSCSGGEYQDYVKINPYLSITPMYVPETELEGASGIWDIENTRYVNNKNWGLNFDMSVKCDVADLFCKMQFALAEPLRVGIERKILRGLKLNTRNNEVAQRVKSLAADELDGQENSNNVQRQYEDCIAALDFDLSALQTACVPCKNNGSRVTSGSV